MRCRESFTAQARCCLEAANDVRREKIDCGKLERNVRCCLLLASHSGCELRRGRGLQGAGLVGRGRRPFLQGRLELCPCAPPSPPRSNSSTSTSGSTICFYFPASNRTICQKATRSPELVTRRVRPIIARGQLSSVLDSFRRLLVTCRTYVREYTCTDNQKLHF